MARFDRKKIGGLEWIGVAMGVIAAVISFFSWRHIKAGPSAADLFGSLGFKSWYTAWGSGVSARLAVLLLIGAAVVILAKGIGIKLPALPFLWAALALTALICVIVRWASLPTPDAGLLAAHNIRPEDIDTGASIGLYLGLIASLISLAGAVARILADARPAPETTTAFVPPTEPSS